SFKGTVDSVRQFSVAIAQARSRKNQKQLIAHLLKIIAQDRLRRGPWIFLTTDRKDAPRRRTVASTRSTPFAHHSAPSIADAMSSRPLPSRFDLTLPGNRNRNQCCHGDVG